MSSWGIAAGADPNSPTLSEQIRDEEDMDREIHSGGQVDPTIIEYDDESEVDVDPGATEEEATSTVEGEVIDPYIPRGQRQSVSYTAGGNAGRCDGRDDPWASGAAPAGGKPKRKTRAELENVKDWLPQFIHHVMTRYTETPNATFNDRFLQGCMRDMLEQMPEEEGKPSIETVMQEFVRSRSPIPSCFDACSTITSLVGHLARNPAGSPFKGYSDTGGLAEQDLRKLEAAWRVVGNAMPNDFCTARAIFAAVVCKRTSGALPSFLQPATMTHSVRKATNNFAVVSVPSYFTPVCAGLENVGHDSTSTPISATFDIVRTCGALDKHPVNEAPFYFKLESSKDSEFNDGSAALVLAKLTRLKETASVKESTEIYDLLESIEDRNPPRSTLQVDVFARSPLMRLTPVVDSVVQMLDPCEATSACGRDRGGNYSIDGSFRFRGRDYERDANTNRVLLGSSLVVHVSNLETNDTVAELRLHYRNAKDPVMETKLFGGGFKQVALKFDRPLDAAAFRNVVGLHEYTGSELEDYRRVHASPSCFSKLLLAYLATFIHMKPTSLPEFGKDSVADRLPDNDEEVQQNSYEYKPNPDALASIAASVVGDRYKFCYIEAHEGKLPISQWWSWSPERLWEKAVEPMILDVVIKSIEGIGLILMEKKLADPKSFDDIEHHFERSYRCSLRPWSTTNSSSSRIEERQADVLQHFRANVDGVIKRLKGTGRDVLVKDVMRAFARICFEKDFSKTIGAPGIDLYPFKNGVQELSAPFGFGPPTPSMRISNPVDIELPLTSHVSDSEFEAFLQLLDEEFFYEREVTRRELDKIAEAMTGTPGGCAQAGLTIWLGQFYVGTTIAASRCGKGRLAAFIGKLLGVRAAFQVPHSVLEQGPHAGKTCEEMKKLKDVHVGFSDEFNSNDEIGHVQKAKHAYINPNVVKNLIPSSTERVCMPFHGKYDTLNQTSGNLVRAYVLANGVPFTNVKDLSVLNRLEVTPFGYYGFNTQKDLEKALSDGLVPEEHRPRCFVVDSARIQGDSKYLTIAARYLVDRIISIRGGNAQGETPRLEDKDKKGWHPPSKFHDDHKAAYIAAVGTAATAKTEYTKEMAEAAVTRVAELRIERCTGSAGQERIAGDETAAFNRFQTASKGMDHCFCRAKNAAAACHFQTSAFEEQLKALAPKASAYFANKPGKVECLQRALGIEVRTIPLKKGVGRGALFGFTLIPADKANIDGTAFKSIENDDGTINYSAADDELEYEDYGEYDDEEYEYEDYGEYDDYK